jgi:CheY-like chemotaxis protein
VLVVDDDALIGALIGEALKAFRVTFVQSATGALGRVEAGGDFSAIVCDLVMPGMSGYQFHAELERIAPDLARRVVFLSGIATSPEVEAFARRARVVCLPKPFEAQKLKAAVAEAAQR